jgi:hypothetical protein
MKGGARMYRIWRQCRSERGIALLIALSIMALLLVGGVFLLRMSSIEGDIAYNAVWAEGSFFAADAAINVGIDQMGPTLSTWTPGSTTIGGSFAYTPSVTFSGTQSQPGFSLGVGTGYNPAGYAFYSFAITGSGTGPRSAQRTIDVTATYGPIAQ